MSNNRNYFSEFVELSTPLNVEVGDGRLLSALGEGSVSLKVNLPNNKIKTCILNHVLFVPDLAHNLISVSQASQGGKVTSFYEHTCKIFNKRRELLAVGHRVGKLYLLNCFHNASAHSLSANSDEVLWHRRFCHLGMSNLRKIISNDLVRGIDCKITKDSFVCENCCDGKNHRVSFPKSEGNKKREVFDLIHSDVCGKLNPGSLGGGYYFVTFIDDASRYTWVFILKNKSDVFETFKNWKALVENQYERKIKVLRTDNGGEYTSTEFEDFLLKEGIRHETTVPKTPEQNGVSERMNRTLIEAVRSMLSDSKLPKTFWAEALSTAVYARNRSPTSVLKDMTPYEALNGRKPNVKHLRTFGCLSYVHIPKDERSKLDNKSKRCIHLGYGSTTKGYRLYDLVAKKVLHSRDVLFDETRCVSSEKESSHESSSDKITFEKESSDKCVQYQIACDEDNEEIVDSDTEPQQDTSEIEAQRPTRIRKAPDRFGEWVNSCIELDEPSTVAEALNSPEAEKWREAMLSEMESISRNDVWTLVESPKECKPINCKWIFKKKIGPDGCVHSYKARLVAQGFSQKIGIDYDETFSPVVRFESVRAVLALAVQHGLHVHQMDVSSAFLNGELSEELYLTQPEGFIDENKMDYVCKLKKAIYGLKQAPKCWNSSLDSYLKQLNFHQSDSDPCIYICITDNVLCIIAVYVDDIIIACKSLDLLRKIKSSLSSRYKMKDLGSLHYFLGVNVIQDNDNIFVNQSAYALSILKKFGLENCKPVSTPVDVSNLLEKASDDSDLFDCETYQSAVGSLLYLSTKTRPDITFAVCNVAKYCSKPTNKHWSAVKRILRYIKGTYSLGILYRKQDNDLCVGFSDADWAGDRNDRKSTSGYCFFLGDNLISWRSCKQSCVALSTAEAEYVALAGASQEALWLKYLLSDLNVNVNDPIVINEDNQSAICIAKNSKGHPKTKHIDIKYHFVRDLVMNGEIKLHYCPTSDMLADIFTKGLSSERFEKLRIKLGICSYKTHSM